jgi:hypothetical protein
VVLKQLNTYYVSSGEQGGGSREQGGGSVATITEEGDGRMGDRCSLDISNV